MVAANWFDVTTGTVPLAAPGANSTITFDSADSNDDCTDLSVTSLNSLNIVDGYSGTVTVFGPLQVGTLNLTGAAASAISQPAEAQPNDITVTTAFTWTNGTLNSSTNQANLNLNGVVTTITPAGEGTLILGDNINTSKGASITFNPGTIEFDTGNGIALGSNTTMNVNADTPQAGAATVTFSGAGKPWSETDKQITLNTGATLTVTGPGSWDDTKHTITNSGGTIEILNNARVNMDLGTPNTVWNIVQSSGTIKLHTGSVLSLQDKGLQLTGGGINIIADSPRGATAPAKLVIGPTQGFLEMNGTSSITFTTPATGWWAAGQQLYWTFEVTGNVTWNGGTLYPRVDGTSLGTDTLRIDGTLSIGAKATMTISPVSYNVPATGLPVTSKWTVVQALQGINDPTLVAVANTTPKYKASVANVAGTNESDINLIPGG